MYRYQTLGRGRLITQVYLNYLAAIINYSTRRSLIKTILCVDPGMPSSVFPTSKCYESVIIFHLNTLEPTCLYF